MPKNNIIKKIFPVLNMVCAACAAKIEKMINELNGVEKAIMNYTTSTVTAEYDSDVASAQTIRSSVQNIGYDIIIEEDKNSADKLEEIQQKQFKQLKNKTIWAIVFSVPVFIIGMFFMNMPYANLIMCVLATPVVFYFGRGFFINAFKQLKHRSVSMDTLVALSTGIAYLFSLFNMLFPQFWSSHGIEPHVYFEASSVIIAFILLGRLLEEKAR